MNLIHDNIISFIKDKDTPIILDVGCYLLEDGIYFGQLYPKSTIFGFEADPRNITNIQSNVLLPNNVSLVPTAISNHNGETTFWPSRDIDFTREYHLSGGINKPTGHLRQYTVRFDDPITVPCQTLDYWYRNSNVYKSPIELIWCDVNGGEKEFLEGSTEILQNTHLLWIECFEEELYAGQVQCEWVTNFVQNLGFNEVWSHSHNKLYKR